MVFLIVGLVTGLLLGLTGCVKEFATTGREESPVVEEVEGAATRERGILEGVE